MKKILPTLKLTKLYINGEWVNSVKGKLLEVYSPSTGKVIQKVQSGTKEDIDHACKVAYEAQKTWGQTTGKHRAEILIKIANEIKKNKERLATIESLDNGKTINEARDDVEDTINCFKYYAIKATELDKKQGEILKNTKLNEDEPDKEFDVKLYYEPVGVCGCIIPFNYPLTMLAWKVAPALSAGCSVILKPSEMTPLNALEFADIVHNLNILPKGVLNVINGTGIEAGKPLTENKLISKVAFTGSVPTGRIVGETSIKDFKRVTLELGGKSPIIVFKDCDVSSTLNWVINGIYSNKGEVCSANSRLLIEEDFHDEFLSKLKEKVKLIKVGDPLDESVNLGAIVCKSQYIKVIDYIKSGIKEGATLVHPNIEDVKVNEEGGYFIKPTLFTNVKKDMKIWKEEIFGPVLSVMKFKSESEAIELSNDSPYGLAASVMTSDKKLASRIARKLQCGVVWINSTQVGSLDAPWGGSKHSGIGRELGDYSLNNFLEVKCVYDYH